MKLTLEQHETVELMSNCLMGTTIFYNGDSFIVDDGIEQYEYQRLEHAINHAEGL